MGRDFNGMFWRSGFRVWSWGVRMMGAWGWEEKWGWEKVVEIWGCFWFNGGRPEGARGDQIGT